MRIKMLKYMEILNWCNNLKGFIPYRYMIDNKKNIIINGK